MPFRAYDRFFRFDVWRRPKTVRLLAAAALLALIVGPGATSQAASTRVTNERTTTSGSSAVSEFEKTTAKTCADGSTGGVYITGILVASQNVTRADGSKVATTALDFTLNTFDLCTGSTRGMNGVLNDAGVYEQRKTDSANVSGVIPLADTSTGESAGTVAVDLNFTATGQATRTSTMIKFVAEGTRIQIKSSGMFANATVTGSMTLNGDDLLAGADTVSASLGTNVLGVITKTGVGG